MSIQPIAISLSRESIDEDPAYSGARRLILNVLLQAFRDLSSCHAGTREDAKQWLSGRVATWYVSLLGYEEPKRLLQYGIRSISCIAETERPIQFDLLFFPKSAPTPTNSTTAITARDWRETTRYGAARA